MLECILPGEEFPSYDPDAIGLKITKYNEESDNFNKTVSLCERTLMFHWATCPCNLRFLSKSTDMLRLVNFASLFPLTQPWVWPLSISCCFKSHDMMMPLKDSSLLVRLTGHLN